MSTRPLACDAPCAAGEYFGAPSIFTTPSSLNRLFSASVSRRVRVSAPPVIEVSWAESMAMKSFMPANKSTRRATAGCKPDQAR
jgi:hypothetical protein